MIPLKELKKSESLGRFLTTYSSDFKPFSDLQPQDKQLNLRTEAQPAPSLISPPQTECETWPIIHQYCYRTSNNTYGSYPEPPSCSLHLPPSPPVSEVTAVAGSDLTESRTEAESVLVEGSKGHLHNVCCGNENVLEQQELKDESQRKDGDPFVEGVIVLSADAIPVCCGHFLSCVCRAVGLQHLLGLPVVVHAGHRRSCGHLSGLRAAGLGENSFLQPPANQCSGCAGTNECTARRCDDGPPHIHQSSSTPLFQVVPAVCSRGLPQTEYRARYGYDAGNQQSDFHRPPQCLLFPPF